MAYENTSANKNPLKVDNKKDTRTALANVAQVTLQLARSRFLKSVTASVSSKISGL